MLPVVALLASCSGAISSDVRSVRLMHWMRCEDRRFLRCIFKWPLAVAIDLEICFRRSSGVTSGHEERKPRWTAFRRVPSVVLQNVPRIFCTKSCLVFWLVIIPFALSKVLLDKGIDHSQLWRVRGPSMMILPFLTILQLYLEKIATQSSSHN